MNRTSLIILAFAIGLTACKPPAPKNPAAESAATPGAANPAAAAAVPAYNLGDVEFNTIPSITLAQQSQIPTIEYSELRNPITKVLSNANAVVSPPMPDHLYVTTTIASKDVYRSQDTVLIRVALKLDSQKDPVVTKSFVVSGQQIKRTGVSFETDLMPYLDPKPASVLVQAWIKIVWFPDTAPATVNADTADDSKGQSVEKTSNPFRIDFK